VSDAFVGRGRQLAIAREALDRVARGQGGVLALAGEAGVGKSRLAREVTALARERDMDVAWAGGWPSGGAPAYWPWPEILATLDPSAADVLEARPDEPEGQRFARFRRTAEVLWRHTSDRPLLVVLDDAHSIDADGLLLTRFVAQGTHGHRVLLVLTQRTGSAVAPAAVELLDEIGRLGVVCRLEGLTPDEVRELLEAHGGPAEAGTVERVCDLTAGVPFLIEQVLDAALHHRAGPIPDPVRRMAEGRLGELDSAEQAVIEAAAVLGTGLVPAELAGVSELDEDTVRSACRRGEAVGLLRAQGSTGYVFVHELAREAVVASMPPQGLAELHDRCVAVLGAGAPTPERARRRARHALARAATSSSHEEEAIAVVRESARTLFGQGSPEAAVGLLEAAVALHDGVRTPDPALLLVELGDALLATGRLRASREVFRRAVTEAVDADDHTMLARAALGLGGVWVLEHRTLESWGSYIDLLGQAIERTGSSESPEAAAQRANLQLRLTAERAAVGEAEPAQVIAAFDIVRAVGSRRDLLSGLSMLHHMLMGPDHAHERLAVADELLEEARTVGDDLHLVLGLLWRASDDLLLGRVADRTLGELRARADALGMRAILFATDAIDVMRQLRAGDLTSAEAAAVACHERGVEVGDADAETYFAAQVLGIQWYRGTGESLLGLAQEMVASSSTPLNNPVFTAGVAAIAAEAGDLDTAEHALALLGRDELGELLQGSTWLVTMFSIVEAAVHLRDAELAQQAYELLLPHEALPMMGGIGVCCFGSTARSLGLAARVAGRLDGAVDHLEHAVNENQRLGNRPMAAITRADLAETLMMRRQPGDRARAAHLIARAIESGKQLGLTGRIGGWTELQARVDRDEDHATAKLERQADVWLIAAGEESAKLAHTAGMEYLARLLGSPGTEITVAELAGVPVVSTPQTLLDAPARRALRQRITEMESAIDSAALRGDTERAAALQHELDELVVHLRATHGPAGRARRFDDASERARTSVQKAIRRAIAGISRDCPNLADALDRSIKTGYRCRYQPVDGAPPRWEVHTS